MNSKGHFATALLGMASLALAATLAQATSGPREPQAAPSLSRGAKASPGLDTQGSPAASTKAPVSQASPAAGAKPPVVRKTAPPLPAMGFAPVRPIDVVRATYDFAAQHPEVLRYVPCYCGCGTEGHSSNDSCFVARRDTKGNVLEWDTHGFGCTICVDVAREAMQLYSSGADVQAIRAAIEKKWSPSHPGTKTPTPFPPKK